MSALLEPIDIPIIEGKPKAAKLTPQDAENIAKLVARRKLNESEACHALGINPQQWFVFKCKSKNSKRYESIITRTKALTINHAMERIETAGIRDWRADHARLALIDPQRFGSKTDVSGTVTHNHSLSDEAMKRIEDMMTKSKESVVDVESSPVKQIE